MLKEFFEIALKKEHILFNSRKLKGTYSYILNKNNEYFENKKNK